MSRLCSRCDEKAAGYFSREVVRAGPRFENSKKEKENVVKLGAHFWVFMPYARLTSLAVVQLTLASIETLIS